METQSRGALICINESFMDTVSLLLTLDIEKSFNLCVYEIDQFIRFIFPVVLLYIDGAESPCQANPERVAPASQVAFQQAGGTAGS